MSTAGITIIGVLAVVSMAFTAWEAGNRRAEGDVGGHVRMGTASVCAMLVAIIAISVLLGGDAP